MDAASIYALYTFFFCCPPSGLLKRFVKLYIGGRFWLFICSILSSALLIPTQPLRYTTIPSSIALPDKVLPVKYTRTKPQHYSPNYSISFHQPPLVIPIQSNPPPSPQLILIECSRGGNPTAYKHPPHPSTSLLTIPPYRNNVLLPHHPHPHHHQTHPSVSIRRRHGTRQHAPSPSP